MPSETPKGVNIGAYEDNRFGMALIPPGTFYRGQAHAVSSDPTDDERPVKLIAVSKPFWMDKVEVTQESFHELMGYNAAERGSGIGSGYGWHGLSLGADLPVTRVDWLEAALYCNERTKAEALANPDGELTIADTVYKYTEMIELDKDVYGNDHSSTRFRTPVDFHTDYSAKGYRLPTEAEWEFAARGAAKTRYSWGELFVDAQDLDQRPGYEYSWGKDATRLEFHAIGRKAPNSLGLFDLLSNAGEWCNDWYLEDYYHVSAVSQDPRGPDDSNYFTHEAPVWTETSAPWTAPKVVRGAAANTVGWSTPFEYYFRSAHRFSYGIYDMHVHGACFTFVGFRCVRVYQGNQSTWPAAIHVAEEIVPDSYDAGPGAPGANIENLTAIPDRVAVAENLTVRWRNNTPTPDVTVQLTKDGGRSWVEISEGAINSPRGDYMQWDYIIPQSLVGETCMIRLAVYGGNIFSAPTGVFEVLAENP
jgi:formylglycine-generating enzyme required for sulfatase activity